MKITKKTILTYILFQGVLLTSSFAQDKHDYITRLGKNLFYREVRDANRTILGMNEIQTVTAGMDGLTVTFCFTANLKLINRPLKLLSFTNSTEENSYLDIFYDNTTITVRRKDAPGSTYYYDYTLYDPMFTIDEDVVMWEIHIFFTGHFFWIETWDTRKSTNSRWHAPLFIGINSPGNNYMADYLERKSIAKIIFGDENPATVFTMPEEIGIYEFKYSDFRLILNDEFSKN